MAAVGKGPHFLQKKPQAEFSGYGPVKCSTNSTHEFVTLQYYEKVGIILLVYQY